MNKISISDNGNVTMPNNVQMRDFELAQLFGVFTSKIGSNIRVILKSGVVRADYRHGATQIGNTIMPDYYDLEMITALAFRIDSAKAEILRGWIMKKALQKGAHQTPIIIQCGDSLFIS